MTNTLKQTLAHRAILALACALSVPGWAAAQATDEVTYYHTDAIGSVRMVTDASGQVVERYDYLPFGEAWPNEVTSTNPRRFAGKEKDQETGFDYFGARTYSSGAGRFTTVDPVLPIEDALLDPQRWNRYTYVMNRPLALTDPDGRCPSCWLLAQRLAQQAAQLASRYGTQAYNWTTRFFNSPTGQEVTTSAAEALTGAQAPSALLPALNATTRTAFLEAAVTEGRGGVSAAGQALQSHASRAGSWLAGLADAGNAANNTAAARKELIAILESGHVTTGVHKVWGSVVYARLPDGRGAVWTAEGEFVTFLERYSKGK